MSKFIPRKCRLLWLCLLGSAFLVGMPATYATEDCSGELSEPSVDIASDSDGLSFSADFGDSNPDKYCWQVFIARLSDGGWDWSGGGLWHTVSDDCDETDDHFSDVEQSFTWADAGITAGGIGAMRANVRAQHMSCPSRWSAWGHSGYELFERSSGD